MADMSGIFGGNAFDPSQVDDVYGFEPMPTNTVFQWEIGDAELKPTSSGTGQRLNVRCNVLGPSHEGRVVFAGFNLQNDSAKAEEIARRELGALCRAVGIVALSDSDALIGQQFLGRCRTKPAKGEYAAQSELDFSTLQPVGGTAPKPAAQARPAAPAPKPAVAKAAPPWAKPKQAA